MPRQTLQDFSIERLSILDAEGEVDASLSPSLSSEQLKNIYKNMLLTRCFDERAIAFQRQGRIGTYPSCLGQEAIHAGTAAALNPEDWIIPSFREQGVLLQRGVAIMRLLLFYMGSEECHRGFKELKILPHNIPCASHLPHGVGIALAEKMKINQNLNSSKNYPAVFCYFGDGSTSEGDFHEALNFASVFQTSNVFICQNNQWAISTPLREQTHSQSLAQKAIAYNIPTIQVDGNDALAVYQATHEFANRARAGKGPALLEMVCYRMGAHTTADDPSRYREDSELETWKKRDPLLRFEKYIQNLGILKEGERNELILKFNEQIKQAAQEAKNFCESWKKEKIGEYLFRSN